MPVPDFSPGEVLTAAAMDSIGLWKIAETTFSATATAFINGCFSSNYQNYLVQFYGASSAGADLSWRFRSGTSTPETGLVYDRFGFYWGTSAVNLVAANNDRAAFGDITNVAPNKTGGKLEIYAPNEAVHTTVNSHTWGSNNGAVWFPSYRVETTTQYTGIEFFTNSGATITGTLRVYGYRN